MSTLPDTSIRWSAFVASVRKRVDDICEEVHAGGRGLAVADPTNPVALLTAQSAIESRIDGLKRKIDAVWSEQNLDELRGAERESAIQERDAGKRYVFETWTTCKVRSLAEYFRGMWPHVERALTNPVACNRCGAPLSPAMRQKTESIDCNHCRATNLFVPDQVVMLWFSHAPQHVAAEQCLSLSLGLLRANEDVTWWIEAEYRRTRARPNEPVESKRRRQALASAYYRAFVAAKARMLGTPESEQNAELARCLANFDLLFP
jgi:hypothetical protein